MLTNMGKYQLMNYQTGALAYTQDGQVLLSSGWNDPHVFVWDTNKGQLIHTLSHPSSVIFFLFTSKLMLVQVFFITIRDDLAACSCNEHIYLWNWKTGALVKRFHTGMVCYYPLPNDYGSIFTDTSGRLQMAIKR